MILICAVCFPAARAQGQSPVTVTVDTRTPGAAIPADFIGLSFETSSLEYNSPRVDGYLFAATNTQVVTLFRNLGIRSLRIGGSSVDSASYTPTNQDIDELFGFADAANLKVIFSVRLKNGDASQDASIADYVWSNYHPYLTCFSIGNEPDLYHGADPAITNISSYLAKWNNFAAAITNAVPDATFGGPDNGTKGTSWASSFADAESGTGIVTWIFSHYYVGGGSSGLTPQQIIDGMLSSTWDASEYPSYYSAIGVMASSKGYPYQLTELNSYVATYPGVWGGNNCFASSLYALDCMHWWSEHNCQGVHFHTVVGKYNGTIYRDANGDYQVYPMGYGIKAFDLGGHGDVMPLTISNADGLNLTAYAVDDHTNLYVTVINKEHDTGARDAAVSIVPDGYSAATASAMLLLAPDNNVGATAGVTLGGAAIANDAPFAGTWAPVMSDTNGQCRLSVPAGSAAVVRINPAVPVAGPGISRDLPPQVTIMTGKYYTYSVEAGGTIPFSYQWYNDTTPIPGATASSYSLNAAPGHYRVVITNAYGAVTSSVSVMTVVSPPADAYASAVLALHPAGYWPLQETNAPAPANLETNYGTLGKAGDAWYAATASSIMGFNEPGALAGDNDPSVRFSGSGSNPNSYAFVPRLTPALTLRPPFTLEAWMNPAGTNYGVLLGEGGGTALNGGPTFGGFHFAWAGNNLTRFEMQLYRYGLNQFATIHTAGAYALNTWYHYVVTYDTASNLTIYVNGQPESNGILPYTPDSWSPLTLGSGKWNYNANGGIRWYNGFEDEVAVYTNLLSPTTISNHYAAGINPASSYPQTVLADHPLLYYRMDHPAYTSTDPVLCPVAFNFGSSPENGVYLPGTQPGGYAGPPVLTSQPASVACPINGVISCVNAGNDAAFNPTATQPFTAMIWFRTYPADGRTQAIMSHGADNSWAISLIGTNGTVIFSTAGGGAVTSTNILNDAEWHCVAGVYDGASNILYVDGLENNSRPATGAIAGNSTADVFLGGDPDYTTVGSNQRYLAGAIAQAAFFTNALAPGQVQQLYMAANTPVLNLSHGTGSNLAITYTGTLLSSTNVAGPYTAVIDATNPYVFTPGPGQKFYRSSHP